MKLTRTLERAAKVLGWPKWEAYHHERWIRPCSNGEYQEIGLHSGSIYPDEAEDFDEASVAPVLADRWLRELRKRVKESDDFGGIWFDLRDNGQVKCELYGDMGEKIGRAHV